MSEGDYSNREIDFHFQQIKDQLDRIEAQTTKTNGRVTKCEENISNLKTTGRVANWAFGITIPMIIGMAIWIYFYQIGNLEDKIENHIELSQIKLEALNK